MALKDIPENFNVDSEEDLRVAVALYFRELGFESDELSFEDYFSIQLGHNSIVIGREDHSRQVTGRSDLLLIRNGKPMAVVETKAPDHSLTDEDALQALSYARLLLEMAPFAIVTNGKDCRVYDTFDPFAKGITPLQTPVDSRWYANGQQIPSIDQDVKFEAARTLIGVNPQTLKSFCQAQMIHGLADLKGTINESKRYVPEIYISRQVVANAFKDWLAGDMPCFALVGESGVGKTNFMCAVAESLSEDYFVLFYPAMLLAEGFLAAIRDDFVWEFHREREVAYIIERFDAIARQIGKKLIIFVDGIDEFPENHEHLKSELIQFVHHLKNRPVRICLSCKAFNWHEFIIDKGQTYNQLAKSVYPPRDSVHNPQTIQSADPQEVSIWLPKFTDDEITEVFPRYKKTFALQGDLRDATRVECQMPLMLRFVAEVYGGRNVDLPAAISSREVFDLYWERRLSEVRQTVAAEQILSEVADLSVASCQREVLLADLRDHLGWNDAFDEAYQDIVRLGLLLVSRDAHGYEQLVFGFEKMRSYVYTVKAKRWPLQKPEDAAQAICALLSNSLGLEAIEFYLVTIDRGETEVLTKLALIDFDCFVQLIGSLDLTSSITQDLPAEKQQGALWNRLQQYAISYSEISRRYFHDLCERIEPYTRGEVGIWAYGSMWQLRTRTKALPNPVVQIAEEVAAALWNGNAAPQIYANLQPAGTLYMSMDDIGEKIPQKLVWDRIRSQVADLFVGRLLDESSSPILLQERVWEILLNEPPRDAPNAQRFWQLLNFDEVQSLGEISIDELMVRVHNLLQEFQGHFPRGVGIESLSHYQYGYYRKWLILRRLYYWLGLLQSLRQHLDLPRFEFDFVFQHRQSLGLRTIIPALESLLPEIIQSHRSLVFRNFAQISERFMFFKFSESPVVVEITRDDYRRSDPTICYVLLPSLKNLPRNPIIYTCGQEGSIASNRIVWQTLKGSWESDASTMRFGRASISRQIGDIHIEDPNAVLCVTRFSGRKFILNQVYQLIGHEAKYVLGDDSHRWYDLEYGRTNDEKLDWWIGRHYAQQARSRPG